MAASALYACTKCTQRYPFEELSQGQQLCKVRGRWVAGGRGFLGRGPRELGARVALQPPHSSPCVSSLAFWGFGVLASSPRDPVLRGPGHPLGKPLRGGQSRALFQAAREGSGPQQR